MILRKYYKTIIILILVLLLSLLPASTVPKVRFLNIPYFDKFVHFFMYFFLTSASLIDIKNNIKKPRRVLILSVIFLIIAISGIIEIIQANYIFGRSGSWYDLLANISGTIISIILFYKTSIFVKPHQDF
jgi:VanZ family protein